MNKAAIVKRVAQKVAVRDIDSILTAAGHFDLLEAERDELRAACAAMREGLEKIKCYFIQKCHNDCPFSMCEGRMCDIYPLQRIVNQILNSSIADRDLLERIRALERVAEAANIRINTVLLNMSYNDELSDETKALMSALADLAALERRREHD